MLLKIIVLTVIVIAVWHGFKFVGRLDSQRKAKLARQASEDAKIITDTVQCPTCNAYVNAAAPGSCGQADCPY
ncbi:MAG: hypothetical protein JKY20_03085 [Alphaproteobacteria bacterium]|nr:hypothetical protein [Alphaproteobacteria bacterium]